MLKNGSFTKELESLKGSWAAEFTWQQKQRNKSVKSCVQMETKKQKKSLLLKLLTFCYLKVTLFSFGRTFSNFPNPDMPRPAPSGPKQLRRIQEDTMTNGPGFSSACAFQRT